VLAAAGSMAEARTAAEEAVVLAYSTEQVGERAAAEQLRDALTLPVSESAGSVAYASDLPG
jgi:hypothetical protein